MEVGICLVNRHVWMYYAGGGNCLVMREFRLGARVQ